MALASLSTGAALALAAGLAGAGGIASAGINSLSKKDDRAHEKELATMHTTTPSDGTDDFGDDLLEERFGLNSLSRPIQFNTPAAGVKRPFNPKKFGL